MGHDTWRDSARNNPSDSITEIVILEQFDYYNQKQNEVLYVNMENMDVLPPTAPSLVFVRETCTPYRRSYSRDLLDPPEKEEEYRYTFTTIVIT